ncbi:uncharacterized protein V6R79_006726 [Siganus canaliculatus]
MDQKENLIDKELSLVVVLPGGEEQMTTVHGSKPLMDLLVTLCAKYHLNPSSHTLELVTSNRKNTKLKPNALIGTLDAEKILLKLKGEDKNKKTGPQMPEATVRMVINYKKTQKTILRVSPRVPLAEHLPAICEKCEFDIETTVLLRDVQSLSPLDLSCSLNDYAIREIYAKDTKGQPGSPVLPASPTHAGTVMPGKDKNQKEEENKGLFSKFRKSKKKPEQAMTASAPASPVLVSKPRPLSMALPSSNSSPLGSPTMLTDVPKKRRAPQPPGLISQSSPSDIGARRRLLSEPTTQLDRDQVTGLTRDSSLKRTKRKAPPPPSPSAAVPETAPVDENMKEGTTAATLEEITEQEESAVSAMSATASDTQGEDSSLNMSADVSMHSPSPDTDALSTMSAEGNGEDQSCDLSSDGNQLQSTVSHSPALSDVATIEDAGSPEPADTKADLSKVETVSQEPISEEPARESDGNSCSTSSLPTPAMQDAEAPAVAQANTETVREQTEGLESPAPSSTSLPTREDAQVQTDVAPPPVPPVQHNDSVSPSATPASESPGKKDMATLTKELEPPDLKNALSDTSETSSCQDSTPSAPATTTAPSVYATNSEPKPKPSNEVTRDYIPKMGMTTYTIVPQKSLEKLRYFEVALTLESPVVAQEDGVHVDAPQLEESIEASKEKRELHSTIPREDSMASTTTTTTAQYTVNESLTESNHSSSTTLPKADDQILVSADLASHASSPTDVKEVKIPPATKPKPGSFRLAQHKKTPGYYVTSAAEKRLSASPTSGQGEAPMSPERAQLPPPPLPPPMQSQEGTTGAAKVKPGPEGHDKNIAALRITRQSSLPSKEPSLGLSLEKLRSFAAPRPYSPATPSRFAQAVSSAVKRSQSLPHGPKVSQSTPLSPTTRHSSVIESKGLEKLEDNENKEVERDQDSTLQGIGSEVPSCSRTVLMEEETTP